MNECYSFAGRGKFVKSLLVIPRVDENVNAFRVPAFLNAFRVRERETSRSCKRVLVPVYIGAYDVRNFRRLLG